MTLNDVGIIYTTRKSCRDTKPVSTDLTVKSDSDLTNPVEKDEVQGWSM